MHQRKSERHFEIQMEYFYGIKKLPVKGNVYLCVSKTRVVSLIRDGARNIEVIPESVLHSFTASVLAANTCFSDNKCAKKVLSPLDAIEKFKVSYESNLVRILIRTLNITLNVREYATFISSLSRILLFLLRLTPVCESHLLRFQQCLEENNESYETTITKILLDRSELYTYIEKSEVCEYPRVLYDMLVDSPDQVYLFLKVTKVANSLQRYKRKNSWQLIGEKRKYVCVGGEANPAGENCADARDASRSIESDSGEGEGSEQKIIETKNVGGVADVSPVYESETGAADNDASQQSTVYEGGVGDLSPVYESLTSPETVAADDDASQEKTVLYYGQRQQSSIAIRPYPPMIIQTRDILPVSDEPPTEILQS